MPDRKTAPGPTPPGSCYFPVLHAPATLVDIDTAERLRRLGIRHLSRLGAYAGLLLERRRVMLHRSILGSPPGEVHHLDAPDRPLGLARTSDNRRAALRALTPAEHRWIESRCPNSSGFRGLSLSSGRWYIRTRLGRTFHGPGFRSPLIAALAWDDLARSVGVMLPRLNFQRTAPCSDVPSLVEATGQAGVAVYFVRRTDGALRNMRCRAAEAPLIPGPGLRFSPTERGLLSVLDLDAGEHRFIPLENVLCLTLPNERVRVSRRAPRRPTPPCAETSSARTAARSLSRPPTTTCVPAGAGAPAAATPSR
jgi:hypothetical protein